MTIIYMTAKVKKSIFVVVDVMVIGIYRVNKLKYINNL